MPKVTRSPAREAALGTSYELRDERAESCVVVVPARGAIVSAFRVGARELLYLDESTLRDPTKNVRGGIPVLFPSPGKLRDDTWHWAGQQGSLPQHGFARTLPWTVIDQHEADAASLTLALESSEQTLQHFPWPFRFELTYALARTCLTIRARLYNTGPSALPWALGFHPYFLVADKARARLDSAATRAFDNVQKREVPFAGFDLLAPELDLHLLDHGSTHSALHFGDGSQLTLRASAEFERWVIWTLAGKDFVCVEPWTAGFDALNSGDGLRTLAPSSRCELQVEIELSRES
jgi:galactose mutarotase-like enzyme